MYICNIYIHIHLYYITFTNIFFFKNTHFPPQHFYKNLSPTSLKSNIFLHVFRVLTNQPTKQQPNNNQQPPIPANNNQQHPTTNNNTKHTTPPPKGGFLLLYFPPWEVARVEWIRAIQRQIAKKSHLAGWYSSHPSYCIFHPGRLPGWCGSEQSRGRLQGKSHLAGWFPPILLHFPPWEAARVEWIRAIQRQIARKITPGRVVSSHPTAFSTLGGCQGGVDQSNPEADCKENHTWQSGFLLLYSSYTNPAQISISPYVCLGTGHSVTLQPPWTSPLFPTHLTHCATL